MISGLGMRWWGGGGEWETDVFVSEKKNLTFLY